MVTHEQCHFDSVDGFIFIKSRDLEYRYVEDIMDISPSMDQETYIKFRINYFKIGLNYVTSV